MKPFDFKAVGAPIGKMSNILQPYVHYLHVWEG